MGGKAHGGLRASRKLVEEIGSELKEKLGETVSKFVLGGSYRRGKPDCGDIDIIVVPVDMDAFDKVCIDLFGYQKSGKPARNGLIRDVQVEFYVASDADFGTFLQMWTGSMKHNIHIRARAKKMGYSMSQYGFKNAATGELVTCATEEEVYKFLKLDFVKPSDR